MTSCQLMASIISHTTIDSKSSISSYYHPILSYEYNYLALKALSHCKKSLTCDDNFRRLMKWRLIAATPLPHTHNKGNYNMKKPGIKFCDLQCVQHHRVPYLPYTFQDAAAMKNKKEVSINKSLAINYSLI